MIGKKRIVESDNETDESNLNDTQIQTSEIQNQNDEQ